MEVRTVKKLICTLLAVSLATALFGGCAGTSQSAGSEAPPSGSAPAPDAGEAGSGASAPGSKTIKFLTVGDPYVGAMKAVLPEFEEQTGIKVVVDSVPYLDLHGKAILELAGDTGSYDMVSIDIPWTGEFAEGGHLYDLTDLVERDKEELQVDDFLPGAWEGLATWDGRVIALPLAPYYMYIHYRTDVFAQKGLAVPETKDEFVNAIQSLYDPQNNFYGLAIALKRGASVVHDWCAYYNGFGGKMFRDMPNDYTTDIDGEIGVLTTQMLKDLVPYLPDGVLQYENADRWNAFMHGNAGMTAVFNANSPQFETAEDTTVAGKVGYTTLPRLDANSQPSLPFAGFSIAINKDSKNVEESWTFMKWMTSPETDKKWVDIPGTPGVPMRISTVTDPELVEKYPYFKIIYDAETQGLADGVDYRSRLPEWTQIEEILGLELNLAVSGEKEVEAALSDAASKINELMKQNGYPVAG